MPRQSASFLKLLRDLVTVAIFLSHFSFLDSFSRVGRFRNRDDSHQHHQQQRTSNKVVSLKNILLVQRPSFCMFILHYFKYSTRCFRSLFKYASRRNSSAALWWPQTRQSQSVLSSLYHHNKNKHTSSFVSLVVFVHSCIATYSTISNALVVSLGCSNG